jgi:hypothetical protein
MKYVPLRDLSRGRCFLESRAEQPNMTRTTINIVSVLPSSATPACAFMKLGCAYELTGTQADTTA